MTITYPPDLPPLPAPSPLPAPDDVEVVVVDGVDPLKSEELALGLAIRWADFDGALFFRTIEPEEFYAEFPVKGARI